MGSSDCEKKNQQVTKQAALRQSPLGRGGWRGDSGRPRLREAQPDGVGPAVITHPKGLTALTPSQEGI